MITWHIPVSYLGTAAAMAALFHWIDPTRYATATFHLVTGGLLLGALFMATDLVTSPVTHRGMLIFGVGCGILTMVIRFWGGVSRGGLLLHPPDERRHPADRPVGTAPSLRYGTGPPKEVGGV